MFQIVSCNKVTRALWRPLSLLKNGGDKKGRSIDCNKIYLRIWGNIDLLYDWRVYGNFKLPAVVIEACFGLWGDERKGTCRLSGNEFQERFLNCLWFITVEGVLNEEHFGQVQLCFWFLHMITVLECSEVFNVCFEHPLHCCGWWLWCCGPPGGGATVGCGVVRDASLSMWSIASSSSVKSANMLPMSLSTSPAVRLPPAPPPGGAPDPGCWETPLGCCCCWALLIINL